MPKGLKRFYGRGHLHFLTFSCYWRLPLLGTARARNVFVAALAKVRERYQFPLVGYVVMPEHVHLLISEEANCTPSLALKVLKQRVSRDLRKRRGSASRGQMRLAFKEGDAELPRFWQARFYDFNVYSAKKKREKLDYMHANPVKRRLAANRGDWAWSSFLNYEKGEKGLLQIDRVD
jgi:putative transposase